MVALLLAATKAISYCDRHSLTGSLGSDMSQPKYRFSLVGDSALKSCPHCPSLVHEVSLTITQNPASLKCFTVSNVLRWLSKSLNPAIRWTMTSCPLISKPYLSPILLKLSYVQRSQDIRAFLTQSQFPDEGEKWKVKVPRDMTRVC